MANNKICDHLVFVESRGGKLIIAVVEFKSRSAHANEVCEQLNNGAQVARQIFEDCSNGDFSFYPIVIAKRWRSPELRMLRKKWVTFSGRKYHIINGECGASLEALVRKILG